VKPKYGIWMTIDTTKRPEYAKDYQPHQPRPAGRPKLVTKKVKMDQHDARIAELKELVTNLREENAELREELMRVSYQLRKVSD
jgi:hypothetical protein